MLVLHLRAQLQSKRQTVKEFLEVYAYLHAVFVGVARYGSPSLLLIRRSLPRPLQSRSVDQPQPSTAPGTRGLSTWLLLGYAARLVTLPRFAPHAQESDLDGLETTEAEITKSAYSLRDTYDETSSRNTNNGIETPPALKVCLAAPTGNLNMKVSLQRTVRSSKRVATSF